jgi:predicted transcriptional regulator of viral defense system
MHLIEFIDSLTAKGSCTFTSKQAKQALGTSDIATRAALRRLKQKGALAQPLHGFYVIVPPEYRVIGCRPADHFINELMEYIDAPYYIGLLSAAQHYGAAHHRVQEYQVITNQKRRPIICGQVKITFITRNSIDDVPIQKVKTAYTYIPASTPEATAMDLVIYPNRSGGLDNVMTVLSDLAEKIDIKMLIKLASETKEITWVQRLGFLFDLIEAKHLSDPLAEIIKKYNAHPRTFMLIKKPKINEDINAIKKLAHKNKHKSKPMINKKWKLIINKKLEPDT